MNKHKHTYTTQTVCGKETIKGEEISDFDGPLSPH